VNREEDAALIAALCAVDPAGVGGVCVRSTAQPARDQWLRVLRELLPPAAPMRRIPFNIADDRLLGGLDLTATLEANRPIAERGVLAAADGGIVVIAMAERLTAHTAACLNAVLDTGEVAASRETAAEPHRARVGMVALDEGLSDDEGVATALLDRLAFVLDLNGLNARTSVVPLHDPLEIVTARQLLPQVRAGADILAALCATALTLGAGSPRVSLLALRVARIAAALDGRVVVSEEDAVLAGRLVLAPRATLAPEQPEDSAQRMQEPPQPDSATPPADSSSAPPPDTSSENASQSSPPESEGANNSRSSKSSQHDLDNVVLAATRAAIPSGLFAKLKTPAGSRSRAGGIGRAGALRSGGTRGRPAGVRSGSANGRARVSLIETLRAAAPWQRLRGRVADGDPRLRVAPADVRIMRYKQRTRTLIIFAVDASGSSALNRLAEAKGAVELLLAECYIRRDEVAVIAFRGQSSEVLLPPTRSLVRAKRSLAGLPGGGGTPLAAAIQSGERLAIQAQRRGDLPILVILTDGYANIARSGAAGRESAHADALLAARSLYLSKVSALFVDTSPRPNPLAKDLAQAMRGRYFALPRADAEGLSKLVKAATG
jgi:magnesium chelatase subunit D